MTTLTLGRPAEAPALDRDYSKLLYWLPLVVILVVQAVLSARLIPQAPLPSGDEGRYIYGGHQLIYELWNGGGSPFYETWFSGAPVIYPVFAAVADHFSGLVGVRLMSLAFMLTASSLLFVCARRLSGYWGGITAAALFAGVGLTQDLGVYGTYDAMAIMTLAVATYCALRTGEQEPKSAMWLLLMPLALFVANATKYMTVIFDPVVIGLAALQLDQPRRIMQRFTVLALAVGGLLLLAVALAGRAYLHGIMFTTLDRKSGLQQFLAGADFQPLVQVVSETWRWVGLVIGASALATVFALPRLDKKRAATLAMLTLAGLIVTLEAIHLHSDQSMRKHDDFGAWFACIGAGALPGYLGASLRGRGRPILTGIAATVIAVAPGFYTTPNALTTYPAIKVNDSLVRADAYLRPYLRNHGRYLIGGLYNEEMLYWDRSSAKWFDNFDDIYIKYPIPGSGGDSHGQAEGKACLSVKPGCMYLEGIAGYRAAIRAHWFSLISLVGGHLDGRHRLIHQDVVIEQAVEHTPGYVLLTDAGGAPTWIYAPAYRKGIR